MHNPKIDFLDRRSLFSDHVTNVAWQILRNFIITNVTNELSIVHNSQNRVTCQVNPTRFLFAKIKS